MSDARSHIKHEEATSSVMLTDQLAAIATRVAAAKRPWRYDAWHRPRAQTCRASTLLARGTAQLLHALSAQAAAPAMCRITAAHTGRAGRRRAPPRRRCRTRTAPAGTRASGTAAPPAACPSARPARRGRALNQHALCACSQHSLWCLYRYKQHGFRCLMPHVDALKPSNTT
jgi:hypothetical protein